MTMMTAPINNAMLTISCQMGTGPTDSLVSMTTGDVKGKSVRKVVKVEKGVSINWLIDITVKISGRLKTKVDWFPSLRLGATAPIPAIRLPYSKKPPMKKGTLATSTLVGMLTASRNGSVVLPTLAITTNVPN